MQLKAFNEHILWKGQIQKTNYSSFLIQPPMVLPFINPLTGRHVPPSRPTIAEEIESSFKLQSEAYWDGVKARQRQYRLLNRLS
jgi:hypothetical protein